MEPRIETKQMTDGTWTAWSQTLGVGFTGETLERALERLALALDDVVAQKNEKLRAIGSALGVSVDGVL